MPAGLGPDRAEPDPAQPRRRVLAGASLYIYLTHWQVHRPLADDSPLLALIVSLAAGIVYAAIATSAIKRLPSWLSAVSCRVR